VLDLVSGRVLFPEVAVTFHLLQNRNC